MNEALMRQHYSWFERSWRSFPRPIYRVDSARAMYLHMHGGLYFDLDFWCLRPLGPEVKTMKGVVLGYMSDDHDFPHSIPNAFMASEPGQPFWLFFLKQIERNAARATTEGPEAVTGPDALFRAVHAWMEHCTQRGVHHNITLYDRKVFYINDWHLDSNWRFTEQEPDKFCVPGAHFQLDKCRRSYPEALTLTQWTHSWESFNPHEGVATSLSGEAPVVKWWAP